MSVEAAELVAIVTARVIERNPEVTDPKEIAKLIEQDLIYMKVQADRSRHNAIEHRAFPGI